MVNLRRLIQVVKYINLAYAGVMLGLAAWAITLIIYGYHFGTGMIPVTDAVVLASALTVIVVGLNIYVDEASKSGR
mgnify:FL=1